MNSKSQMAGAIFLLVVLTVPAGAFGEIGPGSTSGRAGPDLAVVAGSYGITPSPPRVQDICTVNVTVINQGDTNANAFTVAFYLNTTGTPLSGNNRVRVNSLALGATTNVSSQWNTQTTEFSAYFPGINYTIIVVVDSLAEIAEGDETNNRVDYNQTLVREREPNFVLTQMTANPSSLITGGTVTVSVTMTNIGETAGKWFKVWCFANNISTAVYSVEIYMLNISEVRTVTLYWNTSGFAAGDYSLMAIINPDFYYTRINELNWSDNNATRPITVLPLDIRLELGPILIAPAQPHLGDQITINSTLKNNGTYPSDPVNVKISLDGTELSNRSVQLAAGASTSLGAVADTADLDEGVHDILVRAGTINRTTQFTLLPARLADIVIQNVTVTPTHPKVGSPLSIVFEVANAGDAGAGACNWSFFIDYNLSPVDTDAVTPLGPGQWQSFSIVWNVSQITSGSHRFRLHADSGYAVTEFNESNNNHVWYIDIDGETDVGLDNLTLRPAAPKAGDLVSFSLRLRNLGTLKCNSTNVTVKIGNNDAVDSKLINFLDPGTGRDLTLGWQTQGIPAGTYHYQITATVSGNTTDINVNNNILTGTIELLPPPPSPDLMVSNISVPFSSRAKSPLTMFITVENAGNKDAGTSTLMVYFQRGGAMLKFTDIPVAVPAISSGASVKVNVTRDTLSFSAGNYSINVTVDYSNELAELNELNNQFSVPLVLLDEAAKKPVIGIDSVNVDGKKEAGSTLVLSAVISNSGDADAFDVTVRLYLDGKEAGQTTLEQVSRGSTRTVAFTWKATEGSHTYQVKTQGVDSAPANSTAGQMAVTKPVAPVTEKDNPYLMPAIIGGAIAAVAVVAAVILLRRKPGAGAPAGPEQKPWQLEPASQTITETVDEEK